MTDANAAPDAARIGEEISDFKALIPVAVATCVSIISLGVVIPILPFMVSSAGGSEFSAAAIFSIFSFFSFLSAPLWGRVSDRFGRKPVMAAAAAATALAYGWLLIATGLWEIFASRAFAGFSAGWLVASQAFAADVTKSSDRAKAMGLLGAGFGIGFTIGPALSAMTVGNIEADAAPYQTPLFIAIACAILTVVIAILFIKEPDRRKDEDRSESKGLLDVIRTPVLGALFAPYFMVMFVFTMVEGTFAIWAKEILGIGPKEVGFFLAFAGVCSAFTQGGLIGRVNKRFGEVTTATIGASCLFLGALSLGVIESQIWTFLPMALIALALGLHNPSMQGLMSILAPNGWRGGVLGAAQSTASLARILGPALGGLALQYIGVTAQFFIGAALLVPVIYLIRRFKKSAPSI